MSPNLRTLLAVSLLLCVGTTDAYARAELRVRIQQPADRTVLPTTQTSVEVQGGASIYGGVEALDLFLVMDTSKSLRKTDPRDRRTAGAVGLVRSLPARSNIQIGVVDFDGNVELLSPLTLDREAAVRALEKLDQNGGTDIAAGMRTALEGFAARARPGSSRVVLLFTDGRSDEDDARAAMREAGQRGVAVHTLLLGKDRDGETILREIAEGTRGSFLRVEDPRELPRAFLDLRTTGIDRVTLSANDAAPVTAELSGGTFRATLPLRPGRNRLVATAVSLDGESRAVEHEVFVARDLTLSIDAPLDGTELTEPASAIEVTGRVDALGTLFTGREASPEEEAALGVVSVALRASEGAPVDAQISGGRFRALVPVSEGENRIVARATTRDGRSAETVTTVTLSPEGCAELRVEATRGDTPALSISERAIALVVDGSNSMWGRMQGQPKLAVAQQTLTAALDWIPGDMQLALRAYGHTSPHAQKDCRDTALLVPFQPKGQAGSQPGSRQAIRDAISGLKPRGQTPLAYALEQARGDLAGVRGERAVVLVTDGIESCGGDPAAAARALRTEGVPVHVIGFGLGSVEDEDVDALRSIAAASGGRYVTARSAAELREALEATVGTPFHVRQGDRTVANGTLGAGDVIALPAGDYTLRLDSAPPYEVPVELASRQGTTLRFKRQDGKLLRATRSREIPYQRCDLLAQPAEAEAKPETSWEEVPNVPAAPAPGR